MKIAFSNPIDTYSLRYKEIADMEVSTPFRKIHKICDLIWDREKNKNSVEETFEIIKKAISEGITSEDYIYDILELVCSIRFRNIIFYSDLFKLLIDYYDIKYFPGYDEYKSGDYDRLFNEYGNCVLTLGYYFRSIFIESSSLNFIYNDNIDGITDEIKNIENFDWNMTFYNKDLTLIDCACKLGAVKSFKFFLVNGSKITKDTPKYAVESGSMEIIATLGHHGISFENFLIYAVRGNQNHVADWIMEHYGSTGISVGECIQWGNFQAASFFFENGYDIDELYTDEIHSFFHKIY